MPEREDCWTAIIFVGGPAISPHNSQHAQLEQARDGLGRVLLCRRCVELSKKNTTGLGHVASDQKLDEIPFHLSRSCHQVVLPVLHDLTILTPASFLYLSVLCPPLLRSAS
ncbi:hypothetical protein E4T56_gene3002 [Termitomyces sp. T112]|nr:hypothetical protein E4T56_gene3002 [Termitomyces sp. T112]